MKPKKLNLKLTLNKETIANISAEVMSNLHGGVQSLISEDLRTNLPCICCIVIESKGICGTIDYC